MYTNRNFPQSFSSRERISEFDSDTDTRQKQRKKESKENICPLFGLQDDEDSDYMNDDDQLSTKNQPDMPIICDESFAKNHVVEKDGAVQSVQSDKSIAAEPVVSTQLVKPEQPEQKLPQQMTWQHKTQNGQIKKKHHGPFHRALLKGGVPEEKVQVVDFVKWIRANDYKCMLKTKQITVWMPYEEVKKFYPMAMIDFYEKKVKFRAPK